MTYKSMQRDNLAQRAPQFIHNTHNKCCKNALRCCSHKQMQSHWNNDTWCVVAHIITRYVPPECDTLVVEEVAQHNVLDSVCHGCIDDVERHNCR